ncbi:Zn-dependent hydrolase [Chamaesiphon polymorphus]|uniref:Zn-dependent hydrolase n=1 Tax=Chamaesiphon polymorphus CCALA 037 TaxID=2107692 RepID=A0A2T1FAN3_9CYAN|nr:Zn-dependent hydrolase [Chamaesiphon polymorphus]PSB42082.1 Zn-dependent hydrolase [Chamaesiphon polymorphus CCALA 037]
MTITSSPILSELKIDAARLDRSLFELAEIGKLPQGGISRVAFTPEDLCARQLVQTWMLTAGMTVRTDAAGNIIGRYEGLNPDAGAIATGSHIDTVPTGGRYDGCLGVLAGIEVVRVLHERSIRLYHPIEVIVFTDEERSVIGSKGMAGEVREDAIYYARLDGTPIQECLDRIGGDWSQIATAKRKSGEIVAFVELHVEQGGVLEHLDKPIGIVTGVVGQYRFAVNVIGRANHAGTTPMNMRKDALVAASEIVLAVNKIARSIDGDQVATVGYLNVSPNATNTVPGMVDLRIDMRDLSEERLQLLTAKLKAEINAIARTTETAISIQQTLHIRPTLADPQIMKSIEGVCQNMGLAYTHMPSRAGHDAQEIGRFTAMGMIFVPSRAGVSHSADEYTSFEECDRGASVLLHTFLQLDNFDVKSC